MGEANQLQTLLSSDICYRAYKTPEGVLKCHQYHGESFNREMRLLDFIKEYNTLLLKYNKIKNKDYWERLNQHHTANMIFKEAEV